MHQRGLSANFLGCSIQLHQCQHRHWGSGGLDQEQVFGGPRRWSCSTPQPQQNGECLCRHRMGCRFRRSNHLTKCHFLCWNDGLPCTAGTNQSGVPEWGTRKKFPSTRTTRTGGPKRRGFRKGDSGPHSCTADLLHYGPFGYARLGRGSDYHGLFEIWCQLQWTWWSGWPSVTFPVKGRGSAGGTRWFCLLAKSSILLCESKRSLSATGPCWGLHYIGGQCPKGAEATPYSGGLAQTPAVGWQSPEAFLGHSSR